MAWDMRYTRINHQGVLVMATAIKGKPAAKAKVPSKSADEISMTVNRDGQFWIRHGGADPMRIAKDLPMMMAKWKPAHYQVTMTFELPMPAAKKAPAKKIAPMH